MSYLITLTHDGVQHVGLGPAELAARGVPAVVVLAAVKADLQRQVDATAEAIRLRLITPGAGQAMEYQEAQRQADLALADASPTAAAYPMLAASVGIDIDPQTGQPAGDVAGVARSVLAARTAWQAAGAAIRGLRLAGKKAVEDAATAEAAAAAAAAIAWPALG